MNFAELRWKFANAILIKLSENLKVLPIRRYQDRSDIYMERYHIGFLFGWRFYLHRFFDSDPQGLHNHPWKYGFSFILCGDYWEETRFGSEKITWFNTVNGDKFHRIEVNDFDDKPVWSLFIHSPKIGQWGFLRRVIDTKTLAVQTIFEEVGSGAGTSVWHLDPDCLTGKELRETYGLKNS